MGVIPSLFASILGRGAVDIRGDIMPRSNRSRSVTRRRLLAGATALALAPSRRVWAQADEPLRIGFLTVKTGPLAAGGKQQEEGAALFLKERNGLIAGRKVELITQDTAGNTSLAKTKTQELVERYKVPVMIGPLATNEALAMDSYIRDTKVPLITTTPPKRSASSAWRSSPRTLPTATRAPAAFSSRSRRPAARSCRSSGRRST